MSTSTNNQQTSERQTLDFQALEKSILSYWNDTKAFERSVEMRPSDNAFIFYDGPPFATGTPHYGHLLASTIKDVVPRYKTMRGYRVDRVWGWDCHGIPIEHMIEKELGLEGGKKGIEEYGIGQFNAACRSAILRFDADWEGIIERLGRWVDFKNSYKTMDDTFMESVWWGFKQLYEKQLVYQGRRVILYCPRCETPLSNFEIAMDNSYQDVTEPSAFVKLAVIGKQDQYFLAWTTTPWTLLGNVALAVSEDQQYVLATSDSGNVWVAEERLKAVFGEVEPTILERVPGKELVGLEYEPLFRFDPTMNQYQPKVFAGSFVTMEEGTGIVHIAPSYGEDDYKLSQDHDLPVVDVLDAQGKAHTHITPVAGKFYKKVADWVLEELTNSGALFASPDVSHSYPFCYRCGTPLYYNAVPAWFINIQQLKQRLVEQNDKISWYPSHLKHGRFQKGLESAPDWNISRSRYWGTPMPIWIGEKTGTVRVVGSVEELKSCAVNPEQVESLTDLHREFLDEIVVWVDDAKTEQGRRVPEVFDCWVESGSMPFASIHYPFENKEKFEQAYPAQFISEYIAQTRAWFYTLHVLSVGLFEAPSFLNAVTTGTILVEDGSKMSKSKKNFPDPWQVIEKYGVDSLRLYLMSSPVMRGENLSFSEREVDEIRKKVFGVWWNMLSFYDLYCSGEVSVSPPELNPESHVLDRWLIAYLGNLQKVVTESMDAYDVVGSARVLSEAVQEISTWYLRLSRTRLRESSQAAEFYGFALLRLAILFAPITPYFSEMTYHRLTKTTDSVHHLDWPTDLESSSADLELLTQMNRVRSIVQAAHASRRESAIRVRQPLATLQYGGPAPLSKELEELISLETNTERVQHEASLQSDSEVNLDTTLTPDLVQKGKAREAMRTIQDLRKAAGVGFDQQVKIVLPDWPAEYEQEIKDKTLTAELIKGDEPRLLES